MSSIERRIERIWYGGASIDRLISLLLWPLSLVFGFVVYLRRLAFRVGLLASTRIAVPVVVVGNIAVGGTGKTPLINTLVELLAKEGIRAGVVSRGYGRTTSGAPIMVDAASSALEVGDEPLMLARRAGIPVCVCNDRVAAAERMLRDTDVDIILSDDGLQHYRMQRDLEVVVVDGERGMGNGFMLPAGPLREPIGRLRGADFVFINGGSQTIDGCAFELVPTGMVGLADLRAERLEQLAGRRVWALAGIGNPDRFYSTLAAFGIRAMPCDVPDHGRVNLADLRSQQPWPILMTEKDAVKYVDEPMDETWFVPVDVQIPSAIEARFMQRVRQVMKQA